MASMEWISSVPLWSLRGFVRCQVDVISSRLPAILSISSICLLATLVPFLSMGASSSHLSECETASSSSGVLSPTPSSPSAARAGSPISEFVADGADLPEPCVKLRTDSKRKKLMLDILFQAIDRDQVHTYDRTVTSHTQHSIDSAYD